MFFLEPSSTNQKVDLVREKRLSRDLLQSICDWYPTARTGGCRVYRHGSLCHLSQITNVHSAAVQRWYSGHTAVTSVANSERSSLLRSDDGFVVSRLTSQHMVETWLNVLSL